AYPGTTTALWDVRADLELLAEKPVRTRTQPDGAPAWNP
ncbi:MAG: hypothetical protein ACI80N_001523, partial [Gammaproteobacteria bacterium]